MPDTKISALTAGDPALSTDAIPVSRAGANFKITAASIANLYNRMAVVTASGTLVTLTVSSAPVTLVNGSGGQVIQLPNATTLTVGTTFEFNNNQSSGAITVNNNSSTLVASVASGGYSTLTLTANGTSAGTWDRHDEAPSNVSWSTNTFDYSGSITSATWNGVTVATNRGGTGLASFTSGGAVYATSTSALTTGTLPLTAGGTGQTTKAAAFNALSPVTSTGDLIIGNGSNSNTRLPIGTNTYVLTSNGSTASWQPAAGGGGGVTSFDGGFTGLGPYSPTTGAVSLSGTLNASYGGTGSGTSPTGGQIPIGNGSGGYSPNQLTAGSGISIVSGAGGITIAATGGGGPTVYGISFSTSSGTFNNFGGAGTYPLLGYSSSGSNYGAGYFQNTGGAYYITSTSISALSITDSTSAITNYSSGIDFFGPGTFLVMDSAVGFYGMQIVNSALGTLFSNTATATATPSLRPLDASFASGSTNPQITVYQSAGPPYSNQSYSGSGVYVTKVGSNYNLFFGTNDTTFASGFTVTTLQFNINGSLSSYLAGTDFTTFSPQNSSSGMFSLDMSVSNSTLQALLDNSIRT